MRTASLLLCFTLAACAEEPTGQNVYQPLGWAEIEASLPQPEGSRAFERKKLDEVLGTGFCLEGAGARERLARSLEVSGWKVTSAEPLGDLRLDVSAERGAFVLSGSLTLEPARGCSQGFVYTVRKVQP